MNAGDTWKTLEFISAERLSLYNIHYLCVLDYHRKLSIIKKTTCFSAESLILTCKVILQSMDSLGNNVRCQHNLLFQINANNCVYKVREQVVSMFKAADTWKHASHSHASLQMQIQLYNFIVEEINISEARATQLHNFVI